MIILFCEAKSYCCRKYVPISESGSKNKRLHVALMQLKLCGIFEGIITLLIFVYSMKLVVILNEPSVQNTISMA